MLPAIERTEPVRTLIVPRVGARSRVRLLLPWVVFGAVAVVVITGTTLWSVALRTSASSRPLPDAAGIDTGAIPVAVPGTPSAAASLTLQATLTTTATVTVVRRQSPRPRVVAPPPAPAPRPVGGPKSVMPPSAPVSAAEAASATCAASDGAAGLCVTDVTASAPAVRGPGAVPTKVTAKASRTAGG